MTEYAYGAEWGKTEPQRVTDLIREVGLHRLGNLDGCICCNFSIRNVDVEISCGKGGERGIKVSSASMDYENGTSELKTIADEVHRQALLLEDGRGPLPITIEEPR
jgi:hypothetical protein